MNRLAMMFLTVLLFIGAACQESGGGVAAPQSTPELKQSISSGRKTVVFFLNPQGGPCRAQNEVIMQLQQKRGGNFNVVYVSAMKAEDQQAFYDYGVRSLPTLVLVDSKGRIARAFPPGIQSAETIAAALDGAP